MRYSPFIFANPAGGDAAEVVEVRRSMALRSNNILQILQRTIFVNLKRLLVHSYSQWLVNAHEPFESEMIAF